MIELVMSVCMISEPTRCKDVRLNFAEQSVTPHECMFNGQIEIAKWSETHPDWQVAKWGCARAGIYAKA
jgi:hypothetical protein